MKHGAEYVSEYFKYKCLWIVYKTEEFPVNTLYNAVSMLHQPHRDRPLSFVLSPTAEFCSRTTRGQADAFLPLCHSSFIYFFHPFSVAAVL